MDVPLFLQVEPDREEDTLPDKSPHRPTFRPVAFRCDFPRGYRLLVLLSLGFVLLSATSGIGIAQVDTNAFAWVQGGGGAINDKASGVAVDAQTNVIVAGEFSLTLTNGAFTLVSAGSTDVFISKYDALGQLLWSKRFGGALDDSAASVAVDTNGQIYVSGYYRGAVDFGGKPLAAHGGSTLDGFVAKLDRDGSVLWANSIGGSSDDRCTKVAVDPQGNVYAVGSFQGTVALGPSISLVSTNAQSPEAFLIRYNPAGSPIWARRIGSTQGAAGYGLAIGPDGNPCVAGEYLGTALIGGVTLPSSGDRDAFLAKFSAAGDRLWANHYGADGSDGARALAADAAGNLILGGYFSGGADFGGGLLASKARKDFYVLEVSPEGVFRWARAGGGLQDDLVTSVSTTVSGSVYAVGTFGSVLSMGGADLVSAGSGNDAFLLRLDPNGSLRSVARAGGAGIAFDSANAVATGPFGLTFIAGEFSGVATFGTNSLNSGSVTNRDYFVARRFSIPPDITDLSPDVLALVGDPFQLEVVASGEGPFGFQWERNGLALPGATNSVFQRLHAEIADNTEFHVVVSNAEGSVRSPALQVRLFAQLALTSQGHGKALVDPSLLNHALGSTVTLLALPEADAFFSGWTGDITTLSNPVPLTMDGPHSVTAVFGSRRLDLGVIGQGIIQAFPSQDLYNPGDHVQLKAKPAKFYDLVSWSDGETHAVRDVVIGISNRFVAIFTNLVPVETLTFQGTSRTAPVGTPALFVDGQFITDGPALRADGVDLSFKTSYTNGLVLFSLDGSTPSQLFTTPIHVNRPVQVRAIAVSEDFSQSAEMDVIEVRVLKTFLLSVTTPGAGQISVAPQKTRYFSNEVVTFTATPSNGWRFIGWNADATGTNPVISLAIRDHSCVEGIFGTEITRVATGAGEIQLSPNFVLFPYGSRPRFTAVPADGSNFVTWSGAASTPVNPLDLDVVKPSLQLRALFLSNGTSGFPLKVSIDGDGAVVVSPRRTLYASGETVLLFANASPGASFQGWSGGVVASTNQIALTVTNTISLQASFSRVATLGWMHCGDGKSGNDLRWTIRSPLGSVADLEWTTDLSTWNRWGSVTNPFGRVWLDLREFPSPPVRLYRLR